MTLVGVDKNIKECKYPDKPQMGRMIKTIEDSNNLQFFSEYNPEWSSVYVSSCNADPEQFEE